MRAVMATARVMGEMLEARLRKGRVRKSVSVLRGDRPLSDAPNPFAPTPDASADRMQFSANEMLGRPCATCPANATLNREFVVVQWGFAGTASSGPDLRVG